MDAVHAWKSWRVSNAGELLSLDRDAVWSPGVPFRATCGRDPVLFSACSEPPGIKCICGVHAWKHESKARASTPPGAVFGIVSLWGHVVEHEHGFRAEFAYPYDITVPPTAADNTQLLSQMLRRTYIVDVTCE